MRSLAILASLLVAPLAAGETPPELSVRAYVTTAGPYGEMWELNLGVNGKAALTIHYMLNPMGTMSGEFLVSPELVEALRSSIDSERFVELPHRIDPDPVRFHAPDLRLRVTVGGKAHEVAVYDPEALKGDARVERFLAVWKQVFQMVPLTPKW